MYEIPSELIAVLVVFLLGGVGFFVPGMMMRKHRALLTSMLRDEWFVVSRGIGRYELVNANQWVSDDPRRQDWKVEIHANDTLDDTFSLYSVTGNVADRFDLFYCQHTLGWLMSRTLRSRIAAQARRLIDLKK